MTFRLVVAPAERVYSGVTYFPAAAMMMISATLTLWAVLPANSKHLAGFAALAVGLIVWFAAKGRVYIADWLRQLSHQERLAMVMTAVFAFVLPSIVLGKWAPLIGLLVLHVPSCLGLVSAPGFAQAYLLTGLSLIVVTHPLPEPDALVIWGVWLLLVCLTASAEHYLHTFRAHPYGVPGKPFVAIRRGAGRFLLAALITLPFALLTPTIEPVRMPRPKPGLNEPSPLQVTGPLLDPSSPAWMYTLLGLFAVLGTSGILLILVRRLRNSLGGDAPAGDGVPMDTPLIRSLARHRPRRKVAAGAREQIALLYEQMSEALNTLELGRSPEQTPTEYGNRLAMSGRLPAALCEELTQQFTIARYAPEEPRRQDVEKFRKLVRRVLAAAKQSPT